MNILNNTTATGTLEPRKRPKFELIEKAKNDAEDAKGGPEPVKKTEVIPAPAYGSQAYWENRYRNKSDGHDQRIEDDPDPYHAWYFKFADLEPILLPLIVGSDDSIDEDAEENSNEEICDATLKDNEVDSSSQMLPQTIDSPGSNSDPTKLPLQQNNESFEDDLEQKKKNLDADKSNIGTKYEEEESKSQVCNDIESVEWTEIENEEEEETLCSSTIRVGLAKNSPISVLEVGCGDAPLGQDLANSIEEYAIRNRRESSTLIKKVICSDYSKNVIDTMKREQKQKQLQSKMKGIPILYEVDDARNLCYDNQSFEIILEKGTLDAMLSDSDGHGQKNCRKIVSECSRVLTIGGYLIIISHLNAQVESGLEWLNNVIVPGLRATGNFEWLIEVHGSDVDIPSDDDDDAEEENEKQIESPGPAVYFIQKVGHLAKDKTSDGSEQSLPTIPLKFFFY